MTRLFLLLIELGLNSFLSFSQPLLKSDQAVRIRIPFSASKQVNSYLYVINEAYRLRTFNENHTLLKIVETPYYTSSGVNKDRITCRDCIKSPFHLNNVFKDTIKSTDILISEFLLLYMMGKEHLK